MTATGALPRYYPNGMSLFGKPKLKLTDFAACAG